jgi:hypothetical protein
VVLIDNAFRVIMDNARHGPSAIVIAGDPPAPLTAPAAPFQSFHVTTYLDVKFPQQSVNQYQFRIKGFFRIHPLLVVTAFGRHTRFFPFPVTHCENIRDDDYGDNGGYLAHAGGAQAAGKGAPGTPAPGKGGQGKDGHRDSASSNASGGSPLLSAAHVGIATGGLLAVLGALTLFWIRRRRSAA